MTATLPEPATDLPSVPGRPERVLQLADQLREVEVGLARAAALLSGTTLGGWQGPASAAFAALVAQQPEGYRRAAAAAGLASAAVRAHARVLAAAQDEAQVAQERVARSAQRATAARPGSPEEAVEHVRHAHVRQSARDDVEAARRRVARSGADAAVEVRRAASLAPQDPPLAVRAYEWLGRQVDGVGWGAFESGAELLLLASSLSSTRQLTDPQGYAQTVGGLAAGLWQGVSDPAELGRALLDLQTWEEDPAMAVGHLLPDLVAALSTMGAAGVFRARRVEAVSTRRGWEARGRTELGADVDPRTVDPDLNHRTGLTLAEMAAVRAFIADNQRALPRVLSTVQRAVHGRQVHLVPPDNAVKAEKSLARKVANARAAEVAEAAAAGTAVSHAPLDEVLARVGDGLRFTVEIPPDVYAQTVQDLSRHLWSDARLAKDKNFWLNDGYRGINTTWREPGGHLFEVQFHTPESAHLTRLTHHVYDVRTHPDCSPARREFWTYVENFVLSTSTAPQGAAGLSALPDSSHAAGILQGLTAGTATGLLDQGATLVGLTPLGTPPSEQHEPGSEPQAPGAERPVPGSDRQGPGGEPLVDQDELVRAGSGGRPHVDVP